jgi:hypothetical protein
MRLWAANSCVESFEIRLGGPERDWPRNGDTGVNSLKCLFYQGFLTSLLTGLLQVRVPLGELPIPERNKRSTPVNRKRRERDFPAFSFFRLPRKDLRQSAS